VPRGPFVELPGFSKPSSSVLPSGKTRRTAYSLPDQTFDFLEKPEYYFDAFHLNAKGRQRFTEKLATELVAQLGAAGQHASYP
jgi:lysophospholipase L1-like esterase